MPGIPQRERVFAFRDFVLRHFADADAPLTVLDVAGGKGDLSWLLVNADHVDAVVVDPRKTDHSKIARTALWHHETTRDEDVQSLTVARGPQGPMRALGLQPPFRSPRHLRVFMDAELLENCMQPEGDWAAFWAEARLRAERVEPCGHHQPPDAGTAEAHIADAAEALEVIRSCGLILGFHPDQATEACIDLALTLQRPFAVCPCCVFPKEFPQRELHGQKVKTYPDFIEYLQQKHPAMRRVDLCFEPEGGYSRGIVLYMLPADFGLETAPERLQECTDQLKTLLETNVDQCWEMCQRKIKTPVPVTQNWLVKSLLKLLLALLRIELPLDPEKDAKDIPAKEKEVKVENMFWLALVWSFGATTDSAGRKQMDRFIRSIQAGMPVKDEFDLIADDPTFRPVSKTPFPEKDSVFEYFAFAQIMGFDIPKEALARGPRVLRIAVASEHHVLFSGLTGTGKTALLSKEFNLYFSALRSS
ncbi:unnamed protein product [Effrenium voratum]|nr:unnamed protein product [Effrenium voratum]